MDSLAVAARAINNIIGGATVTGDQRQADRPGGTGEQSGELHPVHRIVGRRARAGIPACAPAGHQHGREAALVPTTYQEWVVGATPTAARRSRLFAHSSNPGEPRVQTILKSLAGAG